MISEIWYAFFKISPRYDGCKMADLFVFDRFMRKNPMFEPLFEAERATFADTNQFTIRRRPNGLSGYGKILTLCSRLTQI